MRVYAPGKIILSGEHAVVHGLPALAMAVDRYAIATVSSEHLPKILVKLADIAHEKSFNLTTLKELRGRIKRKYQRFIAGEYPIRRVLQKPFELAHFATSTLAEILQLPLTQGMKMHMHSTIPIGCGMGSSAATILCTLQAVAMYYQLPLSDEQLFQCALEAEHMQHGRSSGLDLRVSITGGCLYFQNNEFSKRKMLSLPLYIVNTGAAASSTGECVQHTTPFFQDKALADAFQTVTNHMDQAIQQQDAPAFKAALAENDQLLRKIGVVPIRVQKFLDALKKQNAVGKVCGAGSVQGDQAGIVLIATEHAEAITALCHEFGFTLEKIHCEERGVHAI